MRWPDFGFEWSRLTPQEATTVAAACGYETITFDRFLVFRSNRDVLTVYIPQGDGYAEIAVKDPAALLARLPQVFRLRENVALPESVPIRFLANAERTEGGLETLPRNERVGFFDAIWDFPTRFRTKDSVTNAADQIANAFVRLSSATRTSEDNEETTRSRELAYDLIREVAHIDQEALNELHAALRDGKDAFANSIISEINDSLQSVLNFPKWWVQDRDFRLLVSPREYDLVFTIRDRTGTEYAFGERSSGLRYFLSYYIQYLAHSPASEKQTVLLMDEPDAFLSHQGQQDLLKIFDAFAVPPNARTPVQVIYVTHSPFLIDKNHGERLRVLEKGVGDEGTRVVGDASRNHYEPLRSAFGAQVGETAFIGNCNLIVEGQSDQILLAGAAAFLRTQEVSELETLDLNRITIVPAGGASHVSYLVHLARGRDIEKPAVIVLLDSDASGDSARKEVGRGGPRRKQLIKPDYVLQIGDLTGAVANPPKGGVVETEDLVPLDICAAATIRYISELGLSTDETPVTLEALRASISDGRPFEAICDYLKALDENLHIEKIGFARAVLETVMEFAAAAEPGDSNDVAVQSFTENFKVLFRSLRKKQRDAERELTAERVTHRIERAKAQFLQDYPVNANRENAIVLFEEMEAVLDDTEEADQIRIDIQSIRRDFRIEEEVTKPIADFEGFRSRLEATRYSARLSSQAPVLQESIPDKATAPA